MRSVIAGIQHVPALAVAATGCADRVRNIPRAPAGAEAAQQKNLLLECRVERQDMPAGAARS
jgi:hypothetical protein